MADPYKTLVARINQHREHMDKMLEEEKDTALLYRAQGAKAIIKDLLEISEQLDAGTYELNQPPAGDESGQ